jgi:murein DD-endopeptidase MepM/ murein hydrolase activator NlpD
MQNDLILTKEQFKNEAFRHYLKTGQGYNYESYLKWVESESSKEQKKKEEEQSNFDLLYSEPDEEEGDYENDEDVYTENYNEEENYTAEELRDVLEDIVYEILAERNKEKTKKENKTSDIQKDNNNLKIEEGKTYVVWSGGSCEQCKGLNGNVYESGDELPETHPNCKCELTILDSNLLPTEESIPLKKWEKDQKKPKPIKKIDISKITFPNEKTEARKLPKEEGRSKAKITSPYGRERINPISKKKEIHTGTDIAGVSEGTPIKSPVGGTVVRNDPVNSENPNKGNGNRITIRDTNGTDHHFYHMKEQPALQIGDKIEKGDTIGKVGNTGSSKGAHLHYEVRDTNIEVDWNQKNDWKKQIVAPDKADVDYLLNNL